LLLLMLMLLLLLMLLHERSAPGFSTAYRRTS
jgi:hypothetical protein